VQSVPGRFWTWTAADATGQVQRVLHAIAGTEHGLSVLAVADGPGTWATLAAALRPELDIDQARAVLTTWNDDPWAGESYSADTLNAAPGDTDLLAAPAGRIHFAGEQTIRGQQRSCIMLDRLVPRVVQRHRPFESGGSSSAFAPRLESSRLAWRACDRSEDQP
jgi:hypothetical protein